MKTLEEHRKTHLTRLRDQKKTALKFTSPGRAVTDLGLALVNQIASYQRHDFMVLVLGQLLHECIMNAFKANLKRVWLSENDLKMEDLTNDPGLRTQFQLQGIGEYDRYIGALRQRGLYVRVAFERTEDSYHIIIENNVPIAQRELDRVNDRIKWAHKANNMLEIMENANDNEEGAGLGLVMNIMLLKNAGIPAENFHVDSEGDTTRVTIIVPNDLSTPDSVKNVEHTIESALEGIPAFPENINRIIALCNDPNSDNKEIAAVIERDPALAASFLKTANSPAFRTGQKISDILMAANILGTKVIGEIATGVAAREILAENFHIYRGFWEHAHKCAEYSRKIAYELKLGKTREIAYLGGLLHDLGRIVLCAMDQQTIDELSNLSLDHASSHGARLEEVSLGISHGEIGARVGEKWNFTDGLVQIIRNHHSPFLAPGDLGVATVHLANAFSHLDDEQASYVHIDNSAMETLGLKSQREVRDLHEKVKAV